MNNIIKLLLFSSVEASTLTPPENNLTQTKLSCESLLGTQKDTCVGLKSKQQTEFLEKLKEQLDSLSDGSKGHLKTVVSIDTFVVKDASCKEEKTVKKAGKTAKAIEGDSEDSDSLDEDSSDDDEETKAAKQKSKKAKTDSKKAKKDAKEAALKAKKAKAEADRQAKLAEQKAAKEAADEKRKAAKEEQDALEKAAKEAKAAKQKAAREEAEAKQIANAETDVIKKKELEDEAAAKKKAAIVEAAAKEKEQKEIAEATRKAKEEEAAAKQAAKDEEAVAKKKAEFEAAAAEAAEAKRKAAEAKEAVEKAKQEKIVAVKNNAKKDPTKPIKAPKVPKVLKATADSEDEEEKELKPKKSSQPVKIKTATDNTKTKKAETDSDDDTTAKKDPKKAAEDEAAAKKALEDAEKEAAEKAEAEKKKTMKETKAEKRAEAAKKAANEAESMAKDKKKKADDDVDDKQAQKEAKEAEEEAQEKRKLAEDAQKKADKAADASKKAHQDSEQCKKTAAIDAKAEDAAEKALKAASDATKEADEATKKAKAAKDKADATSSDDDQKMKKLPKKAETSSDEEEKKKKEAAEAQRKADEAAKVVAARKEKIRKDLADAEAKARQAAEEAEKNAAEKAKRDTEILERKAKEAEAQALKTEREEAKKAQEEAERKAKQIALEAEEKIKAKAKAEEEARKAEQEAKDKAARAIKLAKESEKVAAEELAKKEAAYRAERVAFLDKLSSDVMKGSDKPFVNNELFHVVMYNDGKASMVGRMSFRARTFQDAFERFADLIKPTMMRDTDAEFGLIGNGKLLATTSIFNDNLKDKKVAITGDEYKTDEISQTMIGAAMKEGKMEWPEDLKNNTNKEYQMISYSKKDKKASIKLMGTNYNAAKKNFDIEMKKGSDGILIDSSYRWKYWSSNYNFALQSMAWYFFSKGYYLGVVYDEEKAGFEMQWQVQEKIDNKVKLITGQFTGDGSVFARQQYFYIWMYSSKTGKVTFASRGSFWKMGDAYSWYIMYVTNYLKRDANAEFLLSGSGAPMLSTASWSSEVNKIMIGKSVSQDSNSLKSLNEGSAQYYMLLKNRKSGAFMNEGIGASQTNAYKTFATKTTGVKAENWGILYHSNGKIYKIMGDTSNKDKLYSGDNWGYWAFSDWIMTSRKWWTTWIHTEKEASIILKKEQDALKAADDGLRRQFASRIMKYGGELIDNFNGTGYMFAKNEKFIGIRFNMMKSEINFWTYYATNMDMGYEYFGKQIKSWATRNFKDTRYNPEEYFLFGNNRLLLSSLSTTTIENNGMNMTNAVIGWAYDKNIYIPDDGLLDPDNYKNFWTLLQDRSTNKTTFAKCDSSLSSCTKTFQKVTALNKEEPTKGSRGVLIKGSKDQIQLFSADEDVVYNSTNWNFKFQLYEIVGDFMANNNEGDFDSLYVPDESSAGFEIKAPYYQNKRNFHSMVNILQANKRYYQVHGWWDTYYLKGPITYYGEISKWWKAEYGNKDTADMVQVLMVDVDKYSSKVVMLFKAGQKLNDTRMFLNFGELARIKGYAPNNCTFKVGKGENIKMVSKDKKSGDIQFTDTSTTNWNAALAQAKTLANAQTSTNEIWLVWTDSKVYNIYKDNQNPLGHLEVLGEWIFESCPDYQKVHPTDVELDFPTIYQK